MKITRTSMLTGKTRTLELDVTPQELAKWKAGILIQDAMPLLNDDEREFVKTGITAEEWKATFGDED